MNYLTKETIYKHIFAFLLFLAAGFILIGFGRYVSNISATVSNVDYATKQNISSTLIGIGKATAICGYLVYLFIKLTIFDD